VSVDDNPATGAGATDSTPADATDSTPADATDSTPATDSAEPTPVKRKRGRPAKAKE